MTNKEMLLLIQRLTSQLKVQTQRSRRSEGVRRSEGSEGGSSLRRQRGVRARRGESIKKANFSTEFGKSPKNGEINSPTNKTLAVASKKKIIPATNTMIGWSPDEADREYYVPDTVTTMTEAELNTKVLAIHSANKLQKRGDDGTMSNMTNAEVTAMVSAWVAARS